MTIQNIEDVMDRIMSLNKNLTEDSLRTLLSASGWDKEDILEGLHIFKSNRGNIQPFAPIQNEVLSKVVAPTISAQPVVDSSQSSDIPKPVSEPIITTPKTEPTEDNSYSLNIGGKGESAKDVNTKGAIDTIINNTISDIPVAPTSGIIQNEISVPPQSVNNSATNIMIEKPKNNLGKIIFFILLVLVLTFGLFYFYSSFSSKDNINNTSNNSQNTNIGQNPQEIQNTVNYLDQSASQDTSSSSIVDSQYANLSSSQIEDLIKEVNNLKAQVASYQKSTKSGQTIIKYLSQRGPVGPAGRGVVSIDATSTGFVINYTDKTSSIVPYSTTTILNILNSQGVCFRDSNATISSSTDVCLDKKTVLNLLNK
ncbi:MAG: hypothetical protein U0469_02320 [Candidatus Paceibacterota bacterium]|jgi:uncharacterized protein Smg (DUF494 family)